jgi:hypothetical protein
MPTPKYFIPALLSGAATWPLGSGAQPPERVRHVGVLMNTDADDPAGQTDPPRGFSPRAATIGSELRHNVEIDTAGPGTPIVFRDAAELVALGPDVIVATHSASTGTNATGFIPFEYGMMRRMVGTSRTTIT